MDYRYGSHTVFKIQYHFMLVTKYRYKVLKGVVDLKVRALIRQIYEVFEIEILKGVVSEDHVHNWFLHHPIWRPANTETDQKFDEAIREFC